MKKPKRDLRQLVDFHYGKAGDVAIEYIQQEARKMLTEHPELDEFVMAMGSWGFTWKIGSMNHHGFVIEEGMSQIISEGDVDFIDESDLSVFIAVWVNVLHVTGVPMRFTATGPVETMWGSRK